jgi:surface antigen
MKALKVAALSAAIVALAGCETPPTKEQKGAVSGAVIGGVVGSTIGGGTGRTTAIVLGTIAGALVGGKIGQKMDEADRLKAAQALETTKTGQSLAWTNPDTGNQYAMTPTQTHEQPGDQPCRDFKIATTIDGKTETVTGTACRREDGSWKAKG